MPRLLAIAVALLTILLSASAAGAKEEYWAQICGRSGCKIIKDRLVAAALTSEAEQRGSRSRSTEVGPAYRIRYVLPSSARPTGPAYWLAANEIEFLIRHSQPSVAALFIRARAGVRPFLAPLSRVVFRNFSLRASGIAFELHPTDRPIVVEAAAQADLKVCQSGTTFAGRWRGGCRTLREHPLSLPSTSGAMHVVFRIVPTRDEVVAVQRLTLRWHCVDHRLGVLPGKTRMPRARPVFDC